MIKNLLFFFFCLLFNQDELLIHLNNEHEQTNFFFFENFLLKKNENDIDFYIEELNKKEYEDKFSNIPISERNKEISRLMEIQKKETTNNKNIEFKMLLKNFNFKLLYTLLDNKLYLNFNIHLSNLLVFFIILIFIILIYISFSSPTVIFKSLTLQHVEYLIKEIFSLNDELNDEIIRLLTKKNISFEEKKKLKIILRYSSFLKKKNYKDYI